MKSLKLKEDITWVGSLDPNLRIFDVIMETKYGTTYNSYLVKGSDKCVLFETVKEKFFEDYISKLEEEVEISKIDYLVVSHTEPDHAGSVEKLLKINPEITVIGSRAAIKFMSGILNMEFKSLVVNDGDSLDLGGKTLEFIMAPFLHWPDSIFTYIKEDKAIVTCDAFGTHYSFDEVLLSRLKDRADYYESVEHYFNVIMSPFSTQVLSAIKKIEDKEIELILPGHGPVVDENPRKAIGLYADLSKSERKPEKKIVITYVSAYGYTKALAEALAEGMKTEKDVSVLSYDLVESDDNEVMEEINSADGLLFGSPTVNGDVLLPIWNVLMRMSPVVHSRKLAAAFGSFGWSGEAVPNMESRFKMLRLKQFDDGIKVNFKPSEEDLAHAREYGQRFAKTLLGK